MEYSKVTNYEFRMRYHDYLHPFISLYCCIKLRFLLKILSFICLNISEDQLHQCHEWMNDLFQEGDKNSFGDRFFEKVAEAEASRVPMDQVWLPKGLIAKNCSNTGAAMGRICSRDEPTSSLSNAWQRGWKTFHVSVSTHSWRYLEGASGESQVSNYQFIS